jgi:hypothetical protein
MNPAIVNDVIRIIEMPRTEKTVAVDKIQKDKKRQESEDMVAKLMNFKMAVNVKMFVYRNHVIPFTMKKGDKESSLPPL